MMTGKKENRLNEARDFVVDCWPFAKTVDPVIVDAIAERLVELRPSLKLK